MALLMDFPCRSRRLGLRGTWLRRAVREAGIAIFKARPLCVFLLEWLCDWAYSIYSRNGEKIGEEPTHDAGVIDVKRIIENGFPVLDAFSIA
jgi:hypothetical protein